MDVWWLVIQFNQGCTDWLTGGKICVEGGWATKTLLQSARRTDVTRYRMSMRKSPDLCKAGVSSSEDVHRHRSWLSVLPHWAPGSFRKPEGRCHERLMPFCLHLREKKQMVPGTWANIDNPTCSLFWPRSPSQWDLLSPCLRAGTCSHSSCLLDLIGVTDSVHSFLLMCGPLCLFLVTFHLVSTACLYFIIPGKFVNT